MIVEHNADDGLGEGQSVGNRKQDVIEIDSVEEDADEEDGEDGIDMHKGGDVTEDQDAPGIGGREDQQHRHPQDGHEQDDVDGEQLTSGNRVALVDSQYEMIDALRIGEGILAKAEEAQHRRNVHKI